jgi:hypothetical protein
VEDRIEENAASARPAGLPCLHSSANCPFAGVLLDDVTGQRLTSITLDIMKKRLRPFGFDHSLKSELERLLTIQADLGRAIRSLQMLVPPSKLLQEAGIIGMALHTQALVSYVRCFTSGKRKGLSAEQVYAAEPELLTLHAQIKALRDKHVAHAVGDDEHCAVLVAAADENSPARGLGVRYWFFAGGDDRHMKRFLRLTEVASRHVSAKISRTGDELARLLLGSRATWKRAQTAFYRAVSQEEVYGPTRKEV